MRFISILVLLASTSFLGASEVMRRDTFKQKIDSINFYLTEYDSLPYWCPDEDCYTRLAFVQDKIIGGLLDVLNDPKITKYDLNKCFIQNSLAHTASSDGKIHFFSIDEKTGGTYRSCLTILHSRSSGNVVSARFMGSSQESYGYSSFYAVHLLDSANQSYLALGAVRSCSTCMSEFAIVVSADSSIAPVVALALDFRFDDGSGINYSDSTKSLTYQYAARSDDSLFGERYTDGEEINEETEIINYTGTLIFRHGKFVETENCTSRRFLGED